MNTFKMMMMGTILIAGAAAFAQSAAAKEANRSNVLAACHHQSDCSILTDNPGGLIGCSDKECFYCNKKSCHQIRAESDPGKGVLPNRGITVSTIQGLGGSHTLGPSSNGGNGLAKAQASTGIGHVTLR